MSDEQTFNVLVRMPNWLGDCVMAMPAVKHLSDALPKAKIYLAGRDQFRELFRAQKGVAGFVPAPSSGFGRLVRSIPRTKRLIRKSGFHGDIDLGVLFTNSLSTAAWLWSSGAAIRLGYDRDCRRFFLTHPVPCGGVESGWHFVPYYLWLAKCAESVAFESELVPRRQVEPTAEYMAPSVCVSDKAREGARRILAANGVTDRYVVIAPASAYGEVKDWPPDHWRRLVAMVNGELGLPVVVTGGRDQADVCRAIAEGQKAAFDISGKTDTNVFTGVIDGACAYVGGDSGGAHLAGALGVPTVVIFGVTDPGRTKPGGVAVRILGGLEGSGMKLSTPEARRKAAEALRAITPGEVMAALGEAQELRGHVV